MFTLMSTARSGSMHTTCYTHESFHERTAGFAFLIRAELLIDLIVIIDNPIIKSKQLQKLKRFKCYNHYIVSNEFLS